MANNRLYIVDTENGDSLMVAKSFGEGWDWRVDSNVLNNWLSSCIRDPGQAYGNTNKKPSNLVFRTENEELI